MRPTSHSDLWSQILLLILYISIWQKLTWKVALPGPERPVATHLEVHCAKQKRILSRTSSCFREASKGSQDLDRPLFHSADFPISGSWPFAVACGACAVGDSSLSKSECRHHAGQPPATKERRKIIHYLFKSTG